MNAIQTTIPDVIVLKSKVHYDERGYFFESYNQQKLKEVSGINATFVQDNHSKSSRGTLRGLHYQIHKPQGKLVRVTHGDVFDVAVDLREKSSYFGQWVGIFLSEENRQQLWIPPGFAHGFLVLSDYAELQYKTTDFYSPEDQRCIIWNDPSLAIQWPAIKNPLLSAKDQQGKLLVDSEIYSEEIRKNKRGH